MSDSHNLFWPQALICVTVLACYLLVWPVGEYAVLDEWAFALSLKHLHNDGVVRISDWNPMSLVGLLFWGVMFTKVFGFSLTVAKLSVVVLHVVECLALFRLLKMCAVSTGLSLAAVAVLMFQPLHFVHCYMNMTDVPLLAWQLVSLLCYTRALTGSERRAVRWFALGSLAAGMAFLIRQSGCLVPIAVLGYMLLWDRKRLTPSLLAAAFVPVILVIGVFDVWYRGSHGATVALQISNKQMRGFLAAFVGPLGKSPWPIMPYVALTLLVHLGLFVAPLAAATPLRSYRIPEGRRRWMGATVLLVLVALWSYYAFAEGRVFPYIRNVITPYGMSRPNEVVAGGRDLLWGRGVAWGIGVVGLVGILAFAARVVTPDRPVEAAVPFTVLRRLATVLLVFQLGYLFATTPILYDRHLLMLLPTGLILFCLSNSPVERVQYWRLAICLVPLAFYSIATTHDLHSLSRAAFQAGDELIRNRVNPLVINAGYAFDCWHTYDQRKRDIQQVGLPEWWVKNEFDSVTSDNRPLEIVIKNRRNYWWVGFIRHTPETQYVVSSTPPPEGTTAAKEYTVIGKVPYSNWWPWETKAVYLLEKRP